MSIQRGIRVGFCGAGATGKTSTAKFISEDTKLPFFPSASRIIYENKDLSEEKVQNEFTNDQKLDLQQEIFSVKVQQDRQFQFVADRTVLDHYAYCLAYCGGFMSNEIFTEFDETVQTLMRSTYSHIYYFPWGYWFPEEEDGVRQNLHGWQSQIDALIIGHLHRWNIPAITVPQTMGPEFRNEFVLNSLTGKAKE